MTAEGRVTVAAAAAAELVELGDCPLPPGDPLVAVVGEEACGLLHDEVKTTLVNFFSPLLWLNTLLWHLSAQSVLGEEQVPPPLFGSLKIFQLPKDNPGNQLVGLATSLNVATLVKKICLSRSDIRKFDLRLDTGLMKESKT